MEFKCCIAGLIDVFNNNGDQTEKLTHRPLERWGLFMDMEMLINVFMNVINCIQCQWVLHISSILYHREDLQGAKKPQNVLIDIEQSKRYNRPLIEKYFYLRVLLMLLYPTPTQVISTLSPPFLSSSRGFWTSILNMIWKKSLMCLRNSILKEKRVERGQRGERY